MFKNKKDEFANETPRKYYYRILKEKLAGNDEFINVPIDMCTERADNHKCLTCGSPRMEDCMTPYECRICAVKRVGEEEYKRYIALKSSKQIRTKEDILSKIKSISKEKRVEYNSDKFIESKVI